MSKSSSALARCSCRHLLTTALATLALCAALAGVAPEAARAQCTPGAGQFGAYTWDGTARDYVYCSTATRWVTAQGNCAALRGGNYRLVTLNSAGESTSVDTFASGTDFWIGYNDRSTESTFVWDGLAGSGYCPGCSATVPPGNSANNDCTIQTAAGTWTMGRCDAAGTTRTYVCEDNVRCGNGVRSSAEQCDDGNTTSNDGCSATCRVEYPYTCSDATFPGTCTAASSCANSRSAGLGGSEYVYCGTTASNWAQARAVCQGLGTGWDLVKISSEPENTMVYNLWAADGSRGTSMYNGCRDITADGNAGFNWQWVNDSTSCRGAGATYENWGPGEPNNGNPTQGCGSFWVGVPYQWDDLQCTALMPFTCEGPPTCGNGVRAPSAEQCDDGNTTNGDGCSSTCTIEAAPACGDGTIAGSEACDDGNPSSGDGCSSTCTVEPGYACSGVPSVCTSACAGATWASRSATNTSEYYRCTTAAVWGVGRNNCTMLGSGWNLVTLNDGSENAWVNSTLSGGASRWIGVNDTNAEGTYQWSSGAPFGGYINWASGEPSSAGATDDCGIMLSASGQWDIQTCGNTFGYLCEGPPLCGNGVLAAPEACDDGNSVNGDGCSATCAVEAGYTCTNSTPSTPSTCTRLCSGTPTWSSYLGGTALQTTEYYYCPTAVTWANAQSNCTSVASGWDLTKIAGGTAGFSATQENAHISNVTTATLWIGLNDTATEGVYQWVSDGSTLGAYNDWETGQPDNSGSGAGSDCSAMLDSPSGTWDDLECTTTLGYVCEGPPRCGNGVLASPEGCDDGNLVNGDGCSAACAIESGFGCTPTNPSVCSVITSIALDSLIAYANPTGSGVIVEWIGLYDPSSLGFDLMRRGAHETQETKVNAAELRGTALIGREHHYLVVDAAGSLADSYWVIERKFDGTETRYSAGRVLAEKSAASPPSGSRVASSSAVDGVQTDPGGAPLSSSDQPSAGGCGMAAAGAGARRSPGGALAPAVAFGLALALLRRRSRRRDPLRSR